MELRPAEFELLQPHEFEKLIAGWQFRHDAAEARRKRTERVAAYFVAHLLNMSGKVVKGKISVTDLMEPLENKPAQNDKKADEEYLKQAFPKVFQRGGD